MHMQLEKKCHSTPPWPFGVAEIRWGDDLLYLCVLLKFALMCSEYFSYESSSILGCGCIKMPAIHSLPKVIYRFCLLAGALESVKRSSWMACSDTSWRMEATFYDCLGRKPRPRIYVFHGMIVFPSSYLPPIGLHMNHPCIGPICFSRLFQSSPGFGLLGFRFISSMVANPWRSYRGFPTSVDSTNTSTPISPAFLVPHSTIRLPTPRRR